MCTVDGNEENLNLADLKSWNFYSAQGEVSKCYRNFFRLETDVQYSGDWGMWCSCKPVRVTRSKSVVDKKEDEAGD